MKESFLAAQLIMLNPVAQVVQDMRYVLVTHDTVRLYDIVHGWYVLIPFVIVGIFIILATYYFRKSSKQFAEMI